MYWLLYSKLDSRFWCSQQSVLILWTSQLYWKLKVLSCTMWYHLCTLHLPRIYELFDLINKHWLSVLASTANPAVSLRCCWCRGPLPACLILVGHFEDAKSLLAREMFRFYYCIALCTFFLHKHSIICKIAILFHVLICWWVAEQNTSLQMLM